MNRYFDKIKSNLLFTLCLYGDADCEGLPEQTYIIIDNRERKVLHVGG